MQFWDRPSGEKIAEFDHALLASDTRYPFVVQCEQFKTAALILGRLAALPAAEIFWGREVVSVAQTDDDVSIEVRGPSGIERHGGSFLIGADGGRSAVRKAAGIEFDGFTWPERFIVLTTPFDFAARGYCPRSYFADPEEWCNCFKVAADGAGLWRTVFPAQPGESDEELTSDAGVERRLQKFFPAARRYEVVHRNLYVTHQRVAQRFRKGRVLLAGDAAHVNNPIGGMGLNGGLQDAANLAEKLVRVLAGDAPATLLDLYDRQRRTVASRVRAATVDREQAPARGARSRAAPPATRRACGGRGRPGARARFPAAHGDDRDAAPRPSHHARGGSMNPATPNPTRAPYHAAIAAFAAGKDNPRDFLERCLGQVSALEPRVGAFVALNIEGARKAADRACARWRAGKPLSPLDGMPVGIKDIIETEDMPTEQGSPLFAGYRTGRDGASVAALREAGAVVLGKTVTTEFAASEPRGTRNPWDLERTPGGSSSGSAAAVACGMLPVGARHAGGGLDPAPVELLRRLWLQAERRRRQSRRQL